jgi:hypothetical protein
MNIEDTKKARKLFEAELEKLVQEAKMPTEYASSIAVHVPVNATTKSLTRCPVLADGEEQTTDKFERFFEEEYSGEVPGILVGLEFHKREIRWRSEKNQEEVWIPFWEFVLRKISESLLEEGAVTSRDLFNMEKAAVKFPSLCDSK